MRVLDKWDFNEVFFRVSRVTFERGVAQAGLLRAGLIGLGLMRRKAAT